MWPRSSARKGCRMLYGINRYNRHIKLRLTINPMKPSYLPSLFCTLFFVQSISLAQGKTSDHGNDWPLYHHSPEAWRHSPLKQINAANVSKLKVAWTHTPIDSANGLLATPIVVSGVVYYSDSRNNVYALDGVSGKEIWRYQSKLDGSHKRGWYGPGSRGVTVGHGKVFLGTLDGRFIALDQSIGKELWSTQLIDQKKDFYALFQSPPQLAGNVVIGGSTGGDQPRQGKIYAVDADSGKLAWSFNTIKDDPASWPGESGKYGGGGAWMPGVYDASTGTFFIGTSNPAPDYFPHKRKGDNLYTSSVIALDVNSGKIKWHRQVVPQDAWDYDATGELLTVKHQDRDAIIHFNKGGFVYVIDKQSGSLVNIWKLNDHINWVKSIDAQSGELIGRVDPELGKKSTFCPGVHGGRTWAHGAYNPDVKIWVTSTVEICTEVVSYDADPKRIPPEGLYFGVSSVKNVNTPDGSAYGKLIAADPVSGKLRWSLKLSIPSWSSVLSTAGGLVFHGDVAGNFFAYDVESGNVLWKHSGDLGVRGGPVTYASAEQQFILIPTGMGYLKNEQSFDFMSGLFPDIRRLKKGGQLVAFKLAE